VIDIGDAEYAALGRPTVLPRDRLGAMLERIAAGNPRLIVLDVDVSWPDTLEREAALGASLARLAAGKGPPVFLVREGLPNGPNLPPYLRPTPYDGIVSPASRIRFVSATLLTSSEGIVRRLRPWVVSCRDTSPVVLPGVHLAAEAAISGDDPRAALGKLDAALSPAELPCKPGATRPDRPVNALALSTGKTSRVWRDGVLADRILFRFGWHPGAALSPASALAVLPAQPLLDDPSRVAAELFSNRIVIVGASAGAARDLHQTPLGLMPGVLIVANAVRGEIAEGPTDEGSLWLGLTIALAMSAVTFGVWVLLRRVLDFNVALLREGLKLGLTALWGLIAWVLLAHGAALDFAFPQYIVISYLAYSEGFDKIF
jgi:CHASE2 domain-containing sensor protein